MNELIALSHPQTANQNGELEGQMSSAIMDSFQVTPAKHGVLKKNVTLILLHRLMRFFSSRKWQFFPCSGRNRVARWSTREWSRN